MKNNSTNEFQDFYDMNFNFFKYHTRRNQNAIVLIYQHSLCGLLPNWKFRPRNCLQKRDDGHAWILVSVQEMIIRRRKDGFSAEIVPNDSTKTNRRPPVAAATGLPDICLISPALLLRPPLFHILINCCCCRILCRSSSRSGSGGGGSGSMQR